MYTYTWYEWLAFFYLYCFFGWIFESTYVSLKKHRFVNRGFLHSPLLPLYGTGAVMMLWVSLPVKDNLIAVYFLGVIAATILEYVTGWTMEKLFKMKYWDYSNQPFQLNGYICLSSSIAWGFLTLFLTEIIHNPVETLLFSIPSQLLIPLDLVISAFFLTDTVFSVRTALDLAKVLENLSVLHADLDEIQVQLALLKAETSQRMETLKDGTRERIEQLRSDLRNEVATRMTDIKDDSLLWLEITQERINFVLNEWASPHKRLRPSQRYLDELHMILSDLKLKIEELKHSANNDEIVMKTSIEESSYLETLKEETIKRLSALRNERIQSLLERRQKLMNMHQELRTRLDSGKKRLLRGNPYASSRFSDALKELREELEEKKDHKE